MGRKARGLLTGKQLVFAEEYAKTGDAHRAALRAGYRSTGAVSKLTNNADVMAETERKINQVLHGELFDMSLDLFREVLSSKTVGYREKVTVAKFVADKTIDSVGRDSAAKSLAEMDISEINDLIAKAENEKANLATLIIEHEPANDGIFG